MKFTRYSPLTGGEEIDKTFHSLFSFSPNSQRYEEIKGMSGINVETEDDLLTFSTNDEVLQNHQELGGQEGLNHKFFFATNVSGDIFYFDTSLLFQGCDRVFCRALIASPEDAIDVTDLIDAIINSKPDTL